MLEHLALAARIALHLFDQRLVQLFLADVDLLVAADLGEQQAQAHAPLSDLLVLLLQLLLGLLRVLGVELSLLAVLLDLLPDRVELAVDHRRRHVEAVPVGQLVEQLALGALAGQALVVLADLVAHPLLQRVQVFLAELLRQLVVDLDRFGLAQLLHLNVELRGLTRQLAVHVFVREGDLDGLLLARLDADQLVFEALDETVGAEFQVVVLGLHARVLLAVDLAGEVDHQDVALLGRARLLDRLALLLLGGQPLQRLVDLVVRDLDLVRGHLDLAEVHRFDVRQQLHLHPVDQILALLEGLQLDVRLAGRLQAALLHHLLRGVADRALQHLTHHGLAEALPEDTHRRLARPEARDLLVLADLAQPALNLFIDLVGFQGDHELALEAFVLFFGDLHGPLGPFLCVGLDDGCRAGPHARPSRDCLAARGMSLGRKSRRSRNPRRAVQQLPLWCGRRDLNPHGFSPTRT